MGTELYKVAATAVGELGGRWVCRTAECLYDGSFRSMPLNRIAAAMIPIPIHVAILFLISLLLAPTNKR
jgi:hypothetical protein